ncbi:MAG: histidine kinase [Gammaproteobacteria bacterium]|jgi:signal transduction histidine kinase|nr:histidine kinase [Gammaproteobacteria bacterium]MBU2222612.1 histidine kinase [Gammaproteobacteria bacterium]MBU2426750.1 histidine kinase [Gammaproteobacteria bacterium]
MPTPATPPKDLRHWRREIFTLLAINFVIACLMYLLDDSTSWPIKLVYANSVGCCIWGLTQLGHVIAKQRLPAWLIQLLAVPPGLYIGLKIAAVLGSPDVFQFMQQNPDIGWRSLILPLIAAIIAASFVLVRYQGQVYRAELERERRLLAEYRQADTQAQLMFLQAQIEPHFLFNTLANVHSLITFNPQQAQTMLTHFNSYLRASLQRTRRPLSTLHHEIELIEKLLEIARIRLGDRLSYNIDIAPDLHGKLLPPLLLQPLVENALAHGIEPSLIQGHVRVYAEVHEGQLCLKVTDNGVGLEGQTLQSSSGIGLANVRKRLHHLYGDKARLALYENVPHGCISELCLPLAALDTPPAVLLQDSQSDLNQEKPSYADRVNR